MEMRKKHRTPTRISVSNKVCGHRILIIMTMYVMDHICTRMKNHAQSVDIGLLREFAKDVRDARIRTMDQKLHVKHRVYGHKVYV